MFTNPIGLAAVRSAYGTTTAITRHGEALWEHICVQRGAFRTADIARAFARESGLSAKTAHLCASAFIRYCRTVPGDFHGPASVVTRHGAGYRLTDGANMADYDGMAPTGP